MDCIGNSSAFRIIDANLNRAREALRVMEEYARFGLDDAGLSAAIKETRHALGEAASALEAGGASADSTRESTPLGPPLKRGEGAQARGSSGERGFARAEARGSGPAGEFARAEARGSGDAASSLIRARDIVGDVGREVQTAAEYKRSDAAHVARTAAKRLSEALRAAEEYGKTIDPTFAAAVEKIRYRGYELERRLAMTVDARARFGHVRLYVIMTESLCAGDWLATAEVALRGGADCLQLREKGLPDHGLLERARRLARLCHDNGALLIVNDRPDIAVASGADGVHLGQEDLPIRAARRLVPPRCLVGVSTHTLEQVKAAGAEAPDYIAVGPMFATATKPQDHIAGPEMLAEARRCTSLPLVAIGGITEQNVGTVLSAVPCCVCVCAGVVGQPNVAGAASRLRARVDEAMSASRG